MRIASRLGAAGVALLGSLAIGCDGGAATTGGTSSAGAPRVPSTRLHVTYYPHGPASRARRSWTLTCRPTGGDLPRRAQACAELAAHPRALRPARRPCPLLLVRGAPEALVTGTQRGVAVRRLFRPACDPEWASLHALLRDS